MPGQEFDTVVVGGGSAGSALAGRLTEHPGRRVLVLEAGPTVWTPELRDAASLAATDPAHPHNWAYPAELRTGRTQAVPRGRVLGGSSTINGANWVRATPADCDGWALPGWSYAELLPHYVRSERDLDRGDDPGHGRDGPVPVRRPGGLLRHVTVDRFLVAAERLGFPPEPDKNAGAAPGAGPVPSNTLDGVRVNTAMAYLLPHLDRPNLAVRGDAPVHRVLLEGDRAVGVELLDGTVERAGEVVLAAGAIATPHLLLVSGIGPADDVAAAGIEVLHDRPGVGRNWSDHPAVFLPFTSAGPPAHPQAPGSQAALNLDAGADPAGDCEVLLFVRPFVPGGDLQLMCALQRPDSRGVLTATSPDPRVPPRIEYRYLRTEHDRRRLRHTIRTAADLLRAGLGTRTGPDGAVLGSDRALDGWIAEHLTTSQHLCGSAAMGPAGDPDAVVDTDLRVHGIAGLRIVDTSVLPTVPRRGPAATAAAVGETAGWSP